MGEPTFVIVGASLAGVRAAETLRADGFGGRIVLVGDEQHLPYDRPPLSKGILEGTKEPEQILLREASFYDEQQIDLVLGRRATMLRPADGAVELADGSHLTADAVLIATGGRGRQLAVPGSDLAGVHQLRSLDDALAIRDALLPGARVVVIGGGFVGAEVAASARTRGCDVTVLEVAEIPLGRVLSRDFCERFAFEHRSAGVALRTGVGVASIEGGDRAEAVVATDGSRHPADLVVIGVGIVPNVELAQSAGLATDNGIVVDQHCRTDNPAVFAAGDVANFPSEWLGCRVRGESWQNAADQGATAALNMLGHNVVYQESPWFWSDQYHLSLHMAGRVDGADEIVWRGDLASSSACAFYLRAGVLIGASGINRPKDVRAVLQCVRDRRRVAASLLADESVDLRKALR